MKALLIRIALIAAVVGVVEVLCLTGRIGRFSMQAPHQMLVESGKQVTYLVVKIDAR